MVLYSRTLRPLSWHACAVRLLICLTVHVQSCRICIPVKHSPLSPTNCTTPASRLYSLITTHPSRLAVQTHIKHFIKMASIEIFNNLISRSYINVEAQCMRDYHDRQQQNVTQKTVVLTLLGLILTTSIECVVHSSFKLVSKTTTELQPPPNSPSEIDAPAPNATETLAHSTTQPTPIDALDVSPPVEQTKCTKTSTTIWCEPHPSISTRVRRLTWATILLVPVCLVFGFRMADTNFLNVRHECMKFLSFLPLRPNWWAITLLNIVPFVLAITAWIRALVDCLLVRWGKGLRYPDEDTPLFAWPPCAPVFFVILFAAVPLFLLMGLLNKGARWVAGKTVVENDDVELGEENRGLIVGMDAEDRDMDAPPAYEGLEGARDKYLGMGNESSANGFN